MATLKPGETAAIGIYKPAPAAFTNPFTGSNPLATGGQSFAKPSNSGSGGVQYNTNANNQQSNRNNPTQAATMNNGGGGSSSRYTSNPAYDAPPINAPSGSGKANAGESQSQEPAKKVSSLQTQDEVNDTNNPEKSSPITGRSARYTTEADKAAADYFSELQKPDYEKIKEQKRSEIQSQLTAINDSFINQINDINKTGEENKGKNRALMGRSGLQGSDFGNAQEARVAGDITAALAVKRNEQALAVAALFDKADQRAQERYDIEKTNYLEMAGKRVEYLRAQETEAKNDFIEIAKSGVIQSLDQLSTEDKEMWKEQTGWSDFMTEAVFNVNKPKAAQIDWKQERVGNTIIYSGIDPLTRELKVIKQDLGLNIPEDSDVQVLPNGAMVIVPKKIDPTRPIEEQIQIIGGGGEYAKATGINEEYATYKADEIARGNKNYLSFNDYQTLDANRKARIAGAGATVNITKEQNKFQDDISKAQDDLKSGTTWGAVRDNLYSRYKTGDPAQDKALSDILDRTLDKNTWSKPGAYQEFKKSTQSEKSQKTMTITNKDGTVTTIPIE